MDEDQLIKNFDSLKHSKLVLPPTESETPHPAICYSVRVRQYDRSSILPSLKIGAPISRPPSQAQSK